MKQAILSVLISMTSTVALASTLVIQWEAPTGGKYTYYLDTPEFDTKSRFPGFLPPRP